MPLLIWRGTDQPRPSEPRSRLLSGIPLTAGRRQNGGSESAAGNIRVFAAEFNDVSELIWLCVALALLLTAGLAFAAGMACAPMLQARAVRHAHRQAARLYELAIKNLQTAQETCGWLGEFPGLLLSSEQFTRLRERQAALQETLARLIAEQQQAAEFLTKPATIRSDIRPAWIRTPDDPRTQLPSREAFDANLLLLLDPTRAADEESGLLLIKMDRGEHLRARFGADATQRLIGRLAGVVCRSMREPDLVCRMTTDTLAVLLPSVNPTEGPQVAETVRQAVRHHRFHLKNGTEVLVTASFGYTACHPGEPADLVVDRALDALARSEKLGRNQLHIHTGSPVPV